MPSRAPTYYHWAQDKPCTTNQTYGYSFKDQISEESGKHKRTGPFDYIRPFSNSAFFPEIANDGGMTTRTKMGSLKTDESKSSIRRFDINRGYTMGYTPVTQKVRHSKYPVGVSLDRNTSAPSVYQFPASKSQDLHLWHTLSGNLVHVRNHVPVSPGAQCY